MLSRSRKEYGFNRICLSVSLGSNFQFGALTLPQREVRLLFRVILLYYRLG